MADYLHTVNALVAKHGGTYLARTATHEGVEGRPDDAALRIIIAWPSRDAAHAFMADPDYAPHLKARTENSTSHHLLIAGQDDLAWPPTSDTKKTGRSARSCLIETDRCPQADFNIAEYVLYKRTNKFI